MIYHFQEPQDQSWLEKLGILILLIRNTTRRE